MASRWMCIAWPGFLAACVLELLVFAVIDPAELAWGGQPLGWTRQGAYAIAFFAFWLVASGACAMSSLLRKSAAEINACPFEPGERPGGCPR